MDKTRKYKGLVKKAVLRYVEIVNRRPTPEMEEMLVADDENGIYIWQALGWEKTDRHNYQRVLVRVRNEKIYIEEDWTEQGIATDLIEEGVPTSDIVLAFHEPSMRQYTEFAVA